MVTSRAFKIFILFLTVFLQVNVVCRAQSCENGLGNPVFNQTFGSGVSKPLLNGQTTYRYIARGCPADGEYLITHFTTCFTGNWHNLTEDHTPGDVQGNMLIINAAADAGEFYNQSITQLCYGTTYEFSVWVLNLMNTSESNGCNRVSKVHLDPNITMKVQLLNGEVLQTIYTGSVPRSDKPTWIRYSTTFTTPFNENEVVIKLINNGPGGCGNDLALDDIQIKPCQQPLQISFQDTLGTVLEFCENSTSKAMLVSTKVTSYLNPVYQWQESNDSILWNDITNATQSLHTPTINFFDKRYYRVLCTSAANVSPNIIASCSTISNVLTIVIKPDCQSALLVIPDAFSPNGDGINDRLQLFYNESFYSKLDDFIIRIYNRWGSVVFTSTNLTDNWDGSYSGQICTAGIYSWVIDYQVANNNQKQNFKKQGKILLTR